MYIYTKYYQLFGIRNLRQLSSPPMAMVNRLYLPLSSIYHCTDIDETAVGVLPNDDILSHVNSRESPIFVEHVSSLAPIAQHGHPTELSMSFNTDITEYHRGFKQLRRFNNPNLLNNQKALLVYSYNLIPRHYRYSPQPLTQYHQWANLFLTVIATINRSSVNNNRQHFIQIDMPPRVPPLSHLEAAATTKDRPYMTRFNTDSLRVIADIFAWVSEHTASSLLATLDTRYADRVNFIFMHGGHFTTLNLGMLTKWRVGADGKRGPDVLDPAQLKRRYLSFLMSVSQVSTVVDTLPDVDTMDAVEPTNEIDSKRADIDAEFEDGSAISNDLDVRIKERLETQATGSLADAVARTSAVADNNSVDDIIDTSADVVNEKQLDADLAELEVMATNDEASAAQATFYKPYVAPANTPEAGVQRAADALARQGKLSAAEHRRLVQLSTRYKQLPNPYNTKETLEQLATIAPESLKIGERTPIATAIPGVVDSSMLSSSLSVMDSKYIREVMHKDIAGAVLHMQQMGFVVQNFQVQQVDDFTDSYEVLTINVIPATGKASTLSIKLPRVNENGGFLASGVKCRMRRQRGDIPIRKTKPNEVALTSYISKLFVTRSDLSTFNYDKWLTNEVIKMSLLGDGTKLTNIRMSDVFNGDTKLPYIYTILARKISGFNYGIYKFSFDWTNRIEFFGLEMAAVLDKHKDEDRLLTAVAYAPDSVLLLDKVGDIHEISTRTDAPAVNHGSFESFLGIDTSKRPHDMAEVGIFGKQIPLGIALGFHVGLGNLMSTLKTVYRRVPKGSHHSISDREFALRFADETLIIERNRLNELILGGFNRYAKDIKRYSVYLFDKPEVYANVLDSNQLGVRWIREFVLLFRSWVDHITRDLLIEMREPTDLFLLFIRSAELLMTDQAPHQMDMRYMRDKGYERFAGMVYFEIAKAMRGYLSKPATANAALDLNPKAVWLGLLQDQSVMPTDESNPIHSLKEQEEIIYSGAGGRTARTMTEQARVFHPTVKGVVSEATKDSGDAATVIYTSADPNYTSLRGTTRQLTEDRGNASKIISTSFLMAAGVQNDDQLYSCNVSKLYSGPALQ